MRRSDKQADMIHKCTIVPPSNLGGQTSEAAAVVGRTEQVLSFRPRWRAGDCRWSNKVDGGGGGCLAVGLCLFAVRAEGGRFKRRTLHDSKLSKQTLRTEQLRGRRRSHRFRELNVYILQEKFNGRNLAAHDDFPTVRPETHMQRSLLRRRRLHKRDL